MVWSAEKNGARILRVISDEAEGSLSIWVNSGGLEREIVYEGMFCSQLDESSAGIRIVSVAVITPDELKQLRYAHMAAWLYRECGANDIFLRDMHKRGNHLYVHYTQDNEEYLVLAQKQIFGETRPCE